MNTVDPVGSVRLRRGVQRLAPRQQPRFRPLVEGVHGNLREKERGERADRNFNQRWRQLSAEASPQPCGDSRKRGAGHNRRRRVERGSFNAATLNTDPISIV